MNRTMANLDCQFRNSVVQEIKRASRTGCFRSRREDSMGELSTVCLWQQFRKRNCRDSRNMLIERYAYLVSITAGRLFSPVPSAVERDDLLGAGAVGLVRAIERFDPERNIKFETYAITHIRSAILDMLRGNDWVSRLVRSHQKQLRQANTKLEACRNDRINGAIDIQSPQSAISSMPLRSIANIIECKGAHHYSDGVVRLPDPF